MERSKVYQFIDAERASQDAKWGTTDHKNTPNDWLAYLAANVGKAYTIPFNKFTFRKYVVKVAALAVAILEREDFATNSLEK
jgi:hypothetical protein